MRNYLQCLGQPQSDVGHKVHGNTLNIGKQVCDSKDIISVRVSCGELRNVRADIDCQSRSSLIQFACIGEDHLSRLRGVTS